jgi:hypothetical protein
VEECLPPKFTEWEAFCALVRSFFPNYAIRHATRDELILVKNYINRAVEEHSIESNGASVPSNPTVDADARQSGTRGSP